MNISKGKKSIHYTNITITLMQKNIENKVYALQIKRNTETHFLRLIL